MKHATPGGIYRPRPVYSLPDREFAVTTDPYGISVIDTESGLTVILDWNGQEVKALIIPEGEDEPKYIHTLKTEERN